MPITILLNDETDLSDIRKWSNWPPTHFFIHLLFLLPQIPYTGDVWALKVTDKSIWGYNCVLLMIFLGCNILKSNVFIFIIVWIGSFWGYTTRFTVVIQYSHWRLSKDAWDGSPLSHSKSCWLRLRNCYKNAHCFKKFPVINPQITN